ncbi:lysophospholipid acyltransferase family protein [Psychroflexus maritimus]|uniref:1-acyl-sn-glycerol-3-phosphate acyltransferase n=1 Tax=Psychroflexus maritimus TaxID=2714865 RepID=A0A967E665_9FLAO|nr:lysophospholipid acyltransferase family protein [Psychroflexus maritimus]NGZ89436.1 1-acyl-sn-glycerol-3-phosphate acyltransferase [Psychroflexus maritimus]
MQVLFNFLRLLWRVWFYTWMLVVILLLFPLLLISTTKEKWYPYFYKLARIWAKAMIYGMGFYPKVSFKSNFEKGKSYVLAANHTSMMDIMMMLYLSKNPFVFVGKKELAKMPIFGYFYKRTCILVDRSDPKSRRSVFEASKKRIQTGLSICIFPEGGIPDDENIILDEFKDGAFRVAIDHQIPIVPISFVTNKKRFPYPFFKGSPGVLQANIHWPIPTIGKDLKDKKMLKKLVRELLLKDLNY